MIALHIEVQKREAKILLDVPDKEDEKLVLDELAVFNLYLDLVKKQVADLLASAVLEAGSYDIDIG